MEPKLPDESSAGTRPAPLAYAALRRDYLKGGLRRADLDPNPISQFKKWFDEVRALRESSDGDAAQLNDVNAMTLATADRQGRPSARIVLLKGLDERGFIFFTNYDSRKGRELKENSEAALVFYWPELERQVCVAGATSKVTDLESKSYFQLRPRGSRLAAWASNQSAVVADRATLEKEWARLEMKYPGEEIPKPPHWGGFVVVPSRIEFWQGRPNRLHDRFLYTRKHDNDWQIDRLGP